MIAPLTGTNEAAQLFRKMNFNGYSEMLARETDAT